MPWAIVAPTPSTVAAQGFLYQALEALALARRAAARPGGLACGVVARVLSVRRRSSCSASAKEAIDAYIVIVGFQSVFNHANVSVRLGPLGYLVVTPNFHHRHHSRGSEAIDRSYAAHFAFPDHLLATAVVSDRRWPDHYGVVGDYVPEGALRQELFPFRWRPAAKEEPR